MSASGHGDQWIKKITQSVNEATQTITLTALSFLPPRKIKPDAFGVFYAALLRATARSVQVTAMIASPNTSAPATRSNATTKQKLESDGIKAILIPAPRLLHAKTVLVDKKIGWCGSGNWTAAAAHHNLEFWFRTIDIQAVSALDGFHEQLRSLCRENN